MVHQNQTKTSKNILAIIIVVLAAVATILVFRTLQHNNQPAAGPAENPTSDTQPVANHNPDTAATTDQSDQADQGDQTNSNMNGIASADLTAVISYSGLSGDQIIINVTIDQLLSSGFCTLDLAGTTHTTSIETEPSSSTCSFRLANTLPRGTHPFTVTIASGDQTSHLTGELQL